MELRAVEVQPLVTTDLIAAVQRPMTTTSVAATTVYANADVLRRVLEQLVDNAETPAELAVIAEPTAVLFRIADRGAGIPHTERESVFDARVRAGLAYCRAAVEAFGGRIWIEDNAPTGAVYCFLLPTGN
jgi:two-component system sensor histidine kinase/response regulator